MNQLLAKQPISQPVTRYGGLSTETLYSLYHHKAWAKLDAGERLDLLQETVNREVQANGAGYRCELSIVPLPSSVYGQERNGNIQLNEELCFRDRLIYQSTAEPICLELQDANFLALETALHEHRHSFQTQAVEGKLDSRLYEPELLASLEANQLQPTTVNGQTASQYMQGITSYSLYYLNPSELDANKNAEAKTAAILGQLRARFGEDGSMNTYLHRVERSGVTARLAEYTRVYNCESVDREVAQILKNCHFKTAFPVNAKLEAAVKSEMIATGQRIFHTTMLASKTVGEKKEGGKNIMQIWQPKPVNREMYDAQLRETVNKLYIHEENNPTVSREEAMKITGESAEKYISSMEEFDLACAEKAAQEAELGESCEQSVAGELSAEIVGLESASAMDGGIGTGNGLDGGIDGGVGMGSGI